jgi:hypothetical protein
MLFIGRKPGRCQLGKAAFVMAIVQLLICVIDSTNNFKSVFEAHEFT